MRGEQAFGVLVRDQFHCIRFFCTLGLIDHRNRLVHQGVLKEGENRAADRENDRL